MCFDFDAVRAWSLSSLKSLGYLYLIAAIPVGGESVGGIWSATMGIAVYLWGGREGGARVVFFIVVLKENLLLIISHAFIWC